MTTLAILDSETTGVDPKTDRLIEVGAMLFDADAGVPTVTRSWLVQSPDNAAQAINRIPPSILDRQRWARPVDEVLAEVARFIALGTESTSLPICVAHNAAFDRGFLTGIGDRWICSYADIHWGRVHTGTGSLTTIALALGLGVATAHRAVEDVLLLGRILSRVHELEGSLDRWIAMGLEPKHEVIADVSYADRELAKREGFAWDPARKLWTKRVGESRLATTRAALPFRTRLAA